MVVVSTEGVIIVDSPPGLRRVLPAALGNITHIPVTHMVYTHFHWDHIGAASLFGNNITVIAQEETAQNLIQLEDSDRPLPTITFPHNYELTVGNQTLELSYKGEMHADGNIFVYAPVQKVLMLTDFLYPGWAPSARFGVTKNVLSYVRTHDKVLAYDFDYFVGVHVGLEGNRSDVLIQQEYVLDLRANCISTIREFAGNGTLYGCPDGYTLGQAENPRNLYAFGRRLFELLAVSCASRTSEKWVDRLTGADVVGYDNANIMIESLRLESGIAPTVF